jgi:hypothetical protein
MLSVIMRCAEFSNHKDTEMVEFRNIAVSVTHLIFRPKKYEVNEEVGILRNEN